MRYNSERENGTSSYSNNRRCMIACKKVSLTLVDPKTEIRQNLARDTWSKINSTLNMNCETCAVIFTRLEDIRLHAKSEKHRNQTTIRFSCLPCALPLHNIHDVMQHIGSEEHYIMSLAADTPFDKQAGSSSGLGESFPPLYFCMLCSCRDGNPYGIHMKSVIHKNIARLMRAIFTEQTIHYTNDACDKELVEKLKNPNGPVYCELCNSWSSNWYNFEGHLKSSVHMKTQEFMNKLINVKQYLGDEHACDDICYSFPFACELCNLHFSSNEYYKYHLDDQTHKRVELFMMKISELVGKMDVIIRCSDSDLKISETFNNSLPPLYYCELCDLFCFRALGYVQHKKGQNHKRIEELFSKLSDKRKKKVIHVSLKKDSAKLSAQHYCKLCTVGFLDEKDYSAHLKDKGHLRIQHFINCLTDEGDVNFINVYIDAQVDKIFGKTPPNYCEVCNILHSKSEKYKLHLVSEEHKLAEQSRLEKNFADDSGGNSSKKLKTSHQTLDNVQQPNSARNNSHYNSMEGIQQKKGPLVRNPPFSFEAHDETSSSYPHWPEFVNKEAYSNYPSWFEARPANNYSLWPGHQHPAPYGNYSPLPGFRPQERFGFCLPWPGFQSHEPNGNYPPWSGFDGGVNNGNHPPWPGFQSREPNGNYPPWSGFDGGVNNGYHPPWPGFGAGVSNSNYPPWSSFEAGVTDNNYPPYSGFSAPAYAAHNPSLSGFEIHGSNSIHPPGPGFEAPGPDSICPPGTEVLDNSSSFGFEDGSSQLGFEEPYFSTDEHYCELCDFSCLNSRLYGKHLKSEKHKKLRKLLNKKDKKVCLEAPECETSGHPMQHNCELCDVFNANVQQYELHLGTPKHKRNQWLLYVLMQRPL